MLLDRKKSPAAVGKPFFSVLPNPQVVKMRSHLYDMISMKHVDLVLRKFGTNHTIRDVKVFWYDYITLPLKIVGLGFVLAASLICLGLPMIVLAAMTTVFEHALYLTGDMSDRFRWSISAYRQILTKRDNNYAAKLEKKKVLRQLEEEITR